MLAAQLGLPARALAAPEGEDESAAATPEASAEPAEATEASPPVQQPSGESSAPAEPDAVDPAVEAAPVHEEPEPAPESGEPPTGAAGEPLPDLEQPADAPASVPVEELEAQRPAPAPTLDTDGDLDLDTDEGFDDDFDPLRDSPEAMSARRLFGAGIASMVTGAVLIGGSVALGSSDPCDPNAGNNCFDDARDRAAVTMGAPGGLLLLGGIAMTTIGALQKKRIRASFALGPESYGLVVRGRF